MSNNLLFDLTATQATAMTKYHGASIYALTVFFRAIELGFTNFECIYNPDLFLESKVFELCTEHAIQLLEVRSKSEIKSLIENKKYKKFYSALPYNFFDFNFEKTKFILTIHGLRPLETPNDTTEIFYVPGILRKLKFLLTRTFTQNKRLKSEKQRFKNLVGLKNKEIIAVSEHTKYSLLSLFPNLKNDLVVSYSPIDFSTIVSASEQKDNYFLLVSANRWIKNNYRAIKAFDELFSKGLLNDKEVIVIGVGKVDFAKYIKNKKRFQFIDYVDYELLEEYFNKAFCFVYGTLNEGFGYPPIQAMKYGTPVIASAISAIPEICQNSVCYFNPYSIKELQNRIIQVSKNKAYYNNLRAEGYRRVEELKVKQKEMFQYLIECIFN